MVSEMKQIHAERHKDVYGSPRMHQELVARGFEICESTVAKLMRKEGLSASTHRRFRVRTTDSNHRLPVAENTVNREFQRDQANEVWVSDLMYIPTQTGWFSLVVIIDLYSRQVVGWSMDVRMTTDVFLSALEMALQGAYDPIDLSAFRDSIHHWQMKDGRGRNDPRYRKDQVVHIAENLLKFQNKDGGWPTNLDWLAMVDVQEVRAIRGNTLGRSTLDNRNTYPQIEYLSEVFHTTGLQRYREAAQRGMNYILQEQRSRSDVQSAIAAGSCPFGDLPRTTRASGSDSERHQQRNSPDWNSDVRRQTSAASGAYAAGVDL
jgi:hypothetical protein